MVEYVDKNFLIEDGKVYYSVAKVAEFYKTTPKTVQMWVKRGMPKHAHGWYDLADIRQWKTASGEGDVTEKDKLVADVKLKRAKEELTRIEIAVKNGRLVDIDSVMSVVEQAFVNLKTYMLGIGDRVMSEIVLQYPELATQVRKTINDNVRTGLTELANSGGNIIPANSSKPKGRVGRPKKENK